MCRAMYVATFVSYTRRAIFDFLTLKKMFLGKSFCWRTLIPKAALILLTDLTNDPSSETGPHDSCPTEPNMSSSEEELDRIDQALRHGARRPRVYEERRHLDFDGPDAVFRERYRLSKEAARTLVDRLTPSLARDTDRSHALTPQQQVLCFLRWAGSDAVYHTVRDSHGLSKSSVCRVVRDVAAAIVDTLEAETITFGDPLQQSRLFQEIAQMPSVIGCIDGTHVRVSPPAADEASYVNRHHEHSINVLICCRADLRVQFISARAPGSWHDSRVLRTSRLFQNFDGNGLRPFPGAFREGGAFLRLVI